MNKQNMKILNLYAGIGGNRKLWPKEHEITAVEINPEIAKIYKDFFPNDKVIVADAHQYLLERYQEFDFIWSSPPCPSHSGVNFFLNAQGCIRYPDMSLWQEIIFLQYFFKGKWIVENVIGYYESFFKPLPYNLDRHYFWANFYIGDWKRKDNNISIINARQSTRRQHKTHYEHLENYIGFDLSKYKINDKRRLLQNCVKSELGLHIFNEAFKIKQKEISHY